MKQMIHFYFSIYKTVFQSFSSWTIIMSTHLKVGICLRIMRITYLILSKVIGERIINISHWDSGEFRNFSNLGGRDSPSMYVRTVQTNSRTRPNLISTKPLYVQKIMKIFEICADVFVSKFTRAVVLNRFVYLCCNRKTRTKHFYFIKERL